MKIKTFFIYFCYTGFAFIVLAYFLFPGQKIAKIVSQRINEISPDIEVDLKKINPVLPLGFKTEDSVVAVNKGVNIPIDSIIVYPEILTVFNKKKSAEFNIKAFSGLIKGSISANFKKSLSQFDLQADFSNLKIKDITFSNDVSTVILAFNAGGECGYHAVSPKKGKGSGKITLSDFTAMVNNAFLDQLGIYQFDFNPIDIKYKIDGNKLSILKCTGQGSELKRFSLKGEVVLKQPLEKSIMDLRGELTPDASYLSNLAGISSIAMLFNGSAKGIPFKIKGTPKNPKLSL